MGLIWLQGTVVAGDNADHRQIDHQILAFLEKRKLKYISRTS